MKHNPSHFNEQHQPRRLQPTVAPQDSIARNVVLKKPFSAQLEHEDSELTPRNTTPTNRNGSRDASLARGLGTSSPQNKIITLPPLKAIAAMSLNRVIGKGNTLPWNIPEELQWFKKNTLDQIILMGRKTYESIGRPLPRRESIVLSKSINHIDGVQVIHNLADLPPPPSGVPQKTIWVIGGAEIYNLTIPYTSDLYLTEVKISVPDGDAFFPPFEHLFIQKEIIEDNPLYRVIHYVNTSLSIINK